MKVLFLTNIPSPYRIDFFNELGKCCDLTVVFEKRASIERDKKWKHSRFNTFNGVFLDGISITTDTAFSLRGLSEIKKGKYDVIVSTNFSSLTGILQIVKMKLSRISYCLEADGGFAGSGAGVKEKLKKAIISGAKRYFSTSSACDRYFLTYGAKAEQIVRYPFTSLQEEDVLPVGISQSEKLVLRREIGMTEEKVIISVGRFSYQNGYGKGFDTLVEVCRRLPKKYGVYIIGDNPTDEFIALKERYALDNLHFIPFMVKNELSKYYKAADMSVLLSRGEAWGLVINESMAKGVPVIATDACIAAQEMIEDGQNGFVVEVNDPETVCDKIREYCELGDTVRSQNICLSQARKYTIQRMAQCHYSAFEQLLKTEKMR